MQDDSFVESNPLTEFAEQSFKTELATSPMFAGIRVEDLQEYEHEKVDWLAKDVLSADQPTVFGAASKTLKTTQLLDLAISLSTGKSWLGHFEIPKLRNVLLITGESNYRAIWKKISRAVEAKELDLQDFAGRLRVEAVDFPKVADIVDRERIAKMVEEHGTGVLILDPLYRGLGSLNTSQVGEMGDALVGFTNACFSGISNFFPSQHQDGRSQSRNPKARRFKRRRTGRVMWELVVSRTKRTIPARSETRPLRSIRRP